MNEPRCAEVAAKIAAEISETQLTSFSRSPKIFAGMVEIIVRHLREVSPSEPEVGQRRCDGMGGTCELPKGHEYACACNIPKEHRWDAEAVAPEPKPEISNVTMTIYGAEAVAPEPVCGEYWPEEKVTCGLQKGHSGNHRPRRLVEKEKRRAEAVAPEPKPDCPDCGLPIVKGTKHILYQAYAGCVITAEAVAPEPPLCPVCKVTPMIRDAGGDWECPNRTVGGPHSRFATGEVREAPEPKPEPRPDPYAIEGCQCPTYTERDGGFCLVCSKAVSSRRAEPSQSAPEPKPEVCDLTAEWKQAARSVMEHCIRDHDCILCRDSLSLAEPSQSGERAEEAMVRAWGKFRGPVDDAAAFEAGWNAALSYLQAAKDHERKNK